MSRCFPFPPPGYARNGACGDALIESIKLQREKEKAKAERRKEKKREKKEKKREKKHKNENPPAICNGEKLSEKKSSKGEVKLTGGYLEKSREDEEISSVTQEHEQPIYSQNVSISSDSTHSSYKRKRQTSPLNDTQNHGSIIRIRLPLQKHKAYDESVRKEQLCSNSGRTNSLPQPNIVAGTTLQQNSACTPDTRGKDVAQGLSATKRRHVGKQKMMNIDDTVQKELKEQLCSTSGRTDSLPQPNIVAGTTQQQNSACAPDARGKDMAQGLLATKRRDVGKQKIMNIDETVRKELKEQLCSTSGRTDSLLQSNMVAGTSRQQNSACNPDARGKDIAQGLLATKRRVVGKQKMVNINDTVRKELKEQLCSTSGRTDSLTQSKIVAGTTGQQNSACALDARGKDIAQGLSAMEGRDIGKQKMMNMADTVRKELSHTSQTSTRAGIIALDDAEAASGSTVKNKKRSVELLYKALTENWVPQSFQQEQAGTDDQDWLFGTKQNAQDEGAKRCKLSNDSSCHPNPYSWPCAHYLPEADIFALPYTVPF